MKQVKRLAVVILSLAASASVMAGSSSDCKDAKDKYRSAKSELEYDVRRYFNCVESSGGQDECDSEFRHVKNDQDEFESAVSDIRNDCD